MKLATRARDAVVEAVLAGAAGGAFEATRVTLAAGSARSWAVVAAVACLGAVGAAIIMRAGVAAALRIPGLAGWQRDVADDVGRRVIAVWRAVLVTGALLAFGDASYRVAAWTHVTFRFHDPEPVGLSLAVVLAPLAALVVALAVVIDRRVALRLQGSAWLAGNRVWAAAALAAALVALGPLWIVRRAAPAFTLAGVLTLSVLVVAVLAARVARIGRTRAAQLAALTALVAAGAGMWGLGGSPRARGAIVAYGVTSRPIARMLWNLADRDGDGYPGEAVGGADCDDGDAQRSPAALELPGNGRDENCSGADATDLGERTRPRAAATTTRPNVVLISIDALRADHLGAWGYRRPTAPALDALAKTAVRFAWAFTSCPSTRCAIPSLLTGRYASTLRTRAEQDQVPSIAQVFHDAGWTTAAITCCERFALARYELAGFSTIDASPDSTRMRRAGQSNADVVADTALAWLHDRDASKPFFLWMHFYEPHFPYQAPAGPDFGDRDVDRYDTEIAYADQHIARVLAALDPSTIVVITSDHGDEFGEHGIRFHARSLYNQVVHVPLLVRAPGVTPRVVDAPVSLVDIMPTLLDLAGIAGPRGMNGVSLAPALRGEPAPARPIFIELRPDAQIERDMAAVVSAPWKVIWDREANAWSLYNLADPDDTDDRADDAELPRLQRLLLDTLDRETARVP